jgi:hypothetical protein
MGNQQLVGPVKKTGSQNTSQAYSKNKPQVSLEVFFIDSIHKGPGGTGNHS